MNFFNSCSDPKEVMEAWSEVQKKEGMVSKHTFPILTELLGISVVTNVSMSLDNVFQMQHPSVLIYLIFIFILFKI